MHLTYLDKTPHLRSTLSTKVEGAGAPEINITPETMKKAVNELMSFDERFEFPEEAVLRIYAAICRGTSKIV
jgi:hypothetical protein